MIKTCKLLFQKGLENIKKIRVRITTDTEKECMKKNHVAMLAGFGVTLMISVTVFLFTTNADYSKPDAFTEDNILQEENLFELNLDNDVKDELKKGFSSFYETVYNEHADKVYMNITDNFLPFGVEVYEVLSNKKDTATIEDNTTQIVMAENETGNNDNTQPEPETQTAEPSTEAPTEAPTEPPTEAPTEVPTEAPTEVATEPLTEAPTEIVTEPETVFGDYITVSDFVEPSPSYTNTAAITITDEEYYWLRQIVEAEAGNQDEVGKILVANVIFNRVCSKSFPNSVYDVIFQTNGSVYQFEPVKNGMIYSVTPSYNTISCVDRALNGEDYSQGALYFAMRTSADSWFNRSLTFLFVHGAHYFYR